MDGILLKTDSLYNFIIAIFVKEVNNDQHQLIIDLSQQLLK